MACLFPQAPDLAAFWRNIVGGVDAVGEPTAAWDAQRYLDPGRIKTACGRLPQGAVPLRSARVRDHAELARRRRARPVPRAAHRPRRAGRCRLPDTTTTTATPASSSATAPTCTAARAAILQNTLVLDQTMELLDGRVCPTLDAGQLGRDARAAARASCRRCNADIAPGLVPNVMTGRIANRLDLHGPELPGRRRLLVVAAGGERGDRRAAQRPQPA